MEDMHDLAYVAGWEPFDLYDLAHVSWIGSELDRYRSTIASLNLFIAPTSLPILT